MDLPVTDLGSICMLSFGIDVAFSPNWELMTLIRTASSLLSDFHSHAYVLYVSDLLVYQPQEDKVH